MKSLCLSILFFLLLLNMEAACQFLNWHYEYDLFSSEGSKKVSGPHFSIKIRKSMKWMDGERPNIIKNFLDTTDKKGPFLVVQSRKGVDSRPLKEILGQLVPDGWKIIGMKDNLKIDQCEAGYVETFEYLDAENSPEMVDRGRFLRTYIIRYKNGFIVLMFSITQFYDASKSFSEEDLKYYRKYFHEMAISTIVTSRWRKDY